MSKRILYLDVLRVVSIAGVMSIHYSNRLLGGAEFGKTEWYAYLLYNCFGRFAVPVFFMISGSLFLDSKRELSIKKIYGHNILHLGIAFLFWSTFNAVLDLFQNVWIEKEISFEALETFVKAVALGPTIYWFLFVLIALYMVTPFLRCIAADKKLTEYFLVLWMIFTMFSSFTNPIDSLTLFRDFMSKFQMRFVVGYGGYFLLGYYLRVYFNPTKRQKWIIYGMGIVAYGFTCVATNKLTVQSGRYIETYLNPEMLNCFLMATAVYILIKEICASIKESGKFIVVMYKLAENSLGIYLIHMLVFRLLQVWGITGMLEMSLLSVPCMIIVAGAVCYGMVEIIRKVPFWGRMIV